MSPLKNIPQMEKLEKTFFRKKLKNSGKSGGNFADLVIILKKAT
jgi:hypothetical protein